jgi:hypothetical protein
MTTTTLASNIRRCRPSRSAPTEEGNTGQQRTGRIGIWAAWTLFALTLMYVVVMVLGFIAAEARFAPLVDPRSPSWSCSFWCRP